MRIIKDKQYNKPEFWISAAGLAGLAAAFGVWCGGQSGISVPGLAAAILSAALFAVLGLRFVPVWVRAWRRAPEGSLASCVPDSPLYSPPKFALLRIFAALLFADAAVILLVYGLRLALGYGGSFLESLEFWTCTDSAHYLDIARDWYLSEGSVDRLVQLVFLPGYPLAVRLVNLVAGNYLYSGMIVSALSFAGAGCVIYKLLRLDYTHACAVRALKFLCLLPGAFFFAAPMSESLFLLLCASCIYCARTKKWTLGCLFGGLASFTRSLGLTLFVPLLFELVSSAVKSDDTAQGSGALRYAARFCALFLIPAGFAAYCYINYLVAGDPFKFMQYQGEHWGQHLGWFFNTAYYQTANAVKSSSGDVRYLLGLWLPNLLAAFSSLALMTLAVRKLRPSYTAWFIVYFVIAIGATWLLSAPRYLVAFFPISLSAALLTEKSTANALLTSASALLYILYLLAFVLRWQVW